jgi:hypothetical protein
MIKNIFLILINGDLKHEVTKMTRYWLVCYQLEGFMSVKNVVLKDEHPIGYITRKNGASRSTYYLVNFWEIDQKQYDGLNIFPRFVSL